MRWDGTTTCRRFSPARRAALVAVLGLSVAGCSLGANREARYGGLVVTGIGFAVNSVAVDDRHPDAVGFDFLGSALMKIGAAVFVGSVITYVAVPAARRPAVPTTDDLAEGRARARAEAWRLTKAALAAANRHDCPRVREIEDSVRELDAEFHATVFVRSVTLQRCLAAAAPTPPIGPAQVPVPLPAPPIGPAQVPVPSPAPRVER